MKNGSDQVLKWNPVSTDVPEVSAKQFPSHQWLPHTNIYSSLYLGQLLGDVGKCQCMQ